MVLEYSFLLGGSVSGLLRAKSTHVLLYACGIYPFDLHYSNLNGDNWVWPQSGMFGTLFSGKKHGSGSRTNLQARFYLAMSASGNSCTSHVVVAGCYRNCTSIILISVVQSSVLRIGFNVADVKSMFCWWNSQFLLTLLSCLCFSKSNMWGVPEIGVPQNGWFIGENHGKSN